LPGDTGASIHDSRKKRCTMPASSGENDEYESSTTSVAAAQPIVVVAVATDAMRS
jgi:hypothetical protein